MAEVVEEQFGRKSYLSFRGNLNFCSDEMKRLYKTEKDKEKVKMNFVDAYFNDCHGLKKILSQINKEK